MSKAGECVAVTHAITKLIEQKKAAGWYVGARSEDIRDIARVAVDAAAEARARDYQ